MRSDEHDGDHRARIAELSTRDKLLSISSFPWMARAGSLMTYGADLDDLGGARSR